MRPGHTRPNAEKLSGTSRYLKKDAYNRQSTRLWLGNYVVDIALAHGGPAPVFQWILQRAGSSQILNQGQEASLAEALVCGHRWLERLARKRKPIRL